MHSSCVRDDPFVRKSSPSHSTLTWSYRNEYVPSVKELACKQESDIELPEFKITLTALPVRNQSRVNGLSLNGCDTDDLFKDSVISQLCCVSSSWNIEKGLGGKCCHNTFDVYINFYFSSVVQILDVNSSFENALQVFDHTVIKIFTVTLKK